MGRNAGTEAEARGAMFSTYVTQGDFLGGISSVLDEEGAASDLQVALLSGIASADHDLRTVGDDSAALALDLKVGGWVIRDDDVPIIQALSAIAGAVAASIATGGLALPSVAIAVTGLADLCWRAWRKGARLTEPELAVYGFLAASGPMNEETLGTRLAADDRGVSSETLAATLRHLSAFDLTDGNVVALVAKDTDGLWRARKV
jgi:hypothetical protein